MAFVIDQANTGMDLHSPFLKTFPDYSASFLNHYKFHLEKLSSLNSFSRSSET
jgi:hypothetical protein